MPETINVIHIIPFMQFGAGRHVANLITGLHDLGGFGQFLVTAGRCDDLCDDVSMIDELSDCIGMRLTADVFKRDLRTLTAAAVEISELADSTAAGSGIVFHANTGMSCYCAVAAKQLLAGKRDCRVVTTLMGGASDKPDFFKSMDAWAANHSDLILPISDGVKRLMVGEGVREDLQEVFYCGLYLDKISAGGMTKEAARDLLGIKRGCKVAGTVSQLSPRKGVDAFLRAFKSVAEKYDDAVCLLVGKGHEDVDIVKIAAELGIEDRVVVTGYLENQYAAMSAMDVFVLTSEYEGLGLVNVEAQALGRPVVCFDAGGTPETVLHGETGFVVAAGDEAGLAEKICALFDDRELAGKMGRAGTGWVCERFNIKRNVARLAGLYRGLFE